MTVFYKIYIHVNTHTFPMGMFISSVLKSQANIYTCENTYISYGNNGMFISSVLKSQANIYTCENTYISYGNNGMFISSVLKSQAFSSISSSNGKEVCSCYCFILNSHIVVMQYLKAYLTCWLTNLIDKF